MVRPLTEPLLRALVSEAHADGEHARVLAVAAAPTWTGNPVIGTDTGPVRVVPCVSSLAVREALAEPRAEGETLVILTDRDEADLGEEVLARVWRRRLLRPSGWDALKHQFGVEHLDSALADHRWLVDLLVEVAPARSYPSRSYPSRSYPSPPSGFLDLPTAWRTLLRHALRLDTDRPRAEDLLRWGQTEAARVALAGPARAHADRIAERLVADAGPLAGHVLRLVAEGRGSDLVPFGLVGDVLWAPQAAAEPAVVAARARFETPLGARSLDEQTARDWAEAATGLVRRAAEAGDDPAISAWLARAEHLLAEVGALSFATSSDVLPAAFVHRLESAGNRLAAFLDQPGMQRLVPLEEAAGSVAEHLRAGREPQRARILQMAVRLARRLVGQPPAPAADLAPDTDQARGADLARGTGTGRAADPARRVAGAGQPGGDPSRKPAPSRVDLAQAAVAFAADGAWVDAARDALAEGETVQSLADAYGRLVALVDRERHRRDQAFAAAFAGWSSVEPTGSHRLLPIERVLDVVVTPVARQVPVLLLVLDGLSYPEATRLFSDIAAAGWTPQAPADRAPPLVVAAVPTVTVVSRTSLLCGRLADGDQQTERDGFAEHAGLLRAGGGIPPKLFHKRDLGIEQGRIAPDAHDTIADPAVRVVGVIVNGVDDHLAKGAQLRLADGLAGVKPLRWLLAAAAESGRVVILTSDHGHIREHGTTVRPVPGGGERWRPTDPPPRDDEVAITGPRVLRGDGSIVAPATEAVRYIPTEKLGYHGGATPQEVLCPLAVFTPASVDLPGWLPAPPSQPAWWDPAGVQPSPSQPAWWDSRLARPSAPPSPAPEPALDVNDQPTLFPAAATADEPQPLDAPEWVVDLLASPVLAEQRALAGRGALDDRDLVRLLGMLDAAGGAAPGAALMRATGLPASRLRGRLEALRRMLNVDGYPVLRLEPDGTTHLNRSLLATQFGISAP